MMNELNLYCERCGMPLESDKKLDNMQDDAFIVRPCGNCLEKAKGDQS